MVKVSVIIPIYNTQDYIERCLNSVIEQTLDDIEIIVINDGSTDESVNVIKKINDSRISIINIQHQGQGSAKNEGIKKANGKYIYFLDSDDWIEKNTLKTMYDLAAQENYDIVVSNYNIIKNENIIKIRTNNEESDAKKHYILCGFAQCWKLIKRQMIIDNNLLFPEDIKFEEDSAVVPLYGLVSNKIGFIDDYFYNYYIRENSLSHQKIGKKHYDNVKAITYLLTKSKEINNKYNEEIEFLIIENMLKGAYRRYVDNQTVTIETIRWMKSNSQFIKTNIPKWYKNQYIKGERVEYYLIYKQKIQILRFWSVALRIMNVCKRKIRDIMRRIKKT